MIAYKLARLVNGRINDLDSWHDIAGYALLVHNQIMQEKEAKAAKAATPPQSAKSAKVAADNPFSDKAVIDAMEAEIAKDLSAQQGQ